MWSMERKNRVLTRLERENSQSQVESEVKSFIRGVDCLVGQQARFKQSQHPSLKP